MRHDDLLRKYLKRHVESKIIRNYMTIPFLYLGKMDILYKDDMTDELMYELLNDPDEIEAILPFSEFTVYDKNISAADLVADSMMQDDDTVEKVAKALHVNPHTLFRERTSEIAFIISYQKEKRRWTLTEISGLKSGVFMSLATFNVDTDNKITIGHLENAILVEQELLHSIDFAEIQDETSVLFMQLMMNKLLFILKTLQKARDKHLVEVRRVLTPAQKAANAKSKRKGKPLPHREDLPHYVYLDAPRIVVERSGEPVKGSHKTHRGHNRRGHWRRLTNPRFSNHPKYGSKVWVRPTWVGPTEWTVGNTIYTLKDINVGSEEHGHQYH